MSITIDGELNTIVANNAIIEVHSGLKIPVGNTEQRPLLPIAGMIRFNTTTNNVEGYDGNVWGNLL